MRRAFIVLASSLLVAGCGDDSCDKDCGCVMPDLESGADLAVKPDLAVERDLAVVDDLTVVPPDLLVYAEDWPVTDLAVLDLTVLPPDLLPPPDLVAPADLALPPGTCRGHGDCTTGHCCSGKCTTDACVTTVAGSGRMGAGDGPPDKALLTAQVNGLLPDGEGNVFFLDESSGLRVVNNSAHDIGPVKPGQVGLVTSGVYGCKPGPAAQAEMMQPAAVARDKSGHFYIVDPRCEVVWKLTSDLATVTIHAGAIGGAGSTDGAGGAARFGDPYSITFNPVDGNFYVADWRACTIRQMTVAGVVKTIGGKAYTCASSPDGAAAGMTFYRPIGLTVDAAGSLYVAEYYSGTPAAETAGKIRKITDPAGAAMVTTITPPNLPPYGGGNPSSLAVASDGSIYAALWNSGVWRYAAPLYVVGQAVPSSTASTALALAADGKSLWVGGNHYADNGPFAATLRQVDLAGKILRTVGTQGQPGLVDGPVAQATFDLALCSESASLAVDASGNIWEADACSMRMRRISPAGEVTSFGSGRHGSSSGGSASEAILDLPVAIGVVGGMVYVVTVEDARVLRLDPASGEFTLLGTTCVAGEPGCATSYLSTNLVGDAAGNLYYMAQQEKGAAKKYGRRTDDVSPVLLRIANQGAGAATFFAGTPNQATCTDGAPGVGSFGAYPRGLAMDKAGNIYVADQGCGVRKVDASGNITTVAKGFSPMGLAFTGDGAVLYASGLDNKIYTVDIAGAKATAVAGVAATYSDHFRDGAPGSAIFWGPWAIAAHPTSAARTIYIADVLNNRVRALHQ